MADIKIGRMVLGTCATNTYFLYRDGSEDTIVIDPAEYGDRIYTKLHEAGKKPVAILLTHGHFDHIWGIPGLQRAAAEDGITLPIYADVAEEELLSNPRHNLSHSAGRDAIVKPDVLLKDGETFELAGIRVKMLSTPGHTVGGCCFYIEDAGFLISGDTLFQESVGRTDFPGGSMSTLVRGIKEKLFVLPDETKVYPGHGDSTTIGLEKQYNPFCGE